MKSMKKILGVSALALAACGSLSFGVLSASANTEEAKDILTLDGASVRYIIADETPNKSGIRFSGYVSESFKAENPDAEVGMLVIPTDLLTGELTENTAQVGIAPVATYATDAQDDKAGYDRFNTVLYGIPEASYGADVSVRAYTKVDGVYALADETVTRSIGEVASHALLKSNENAEELMAYVDGALESFEAADHVVVKLNENQPLGAVITPNNLAAIYTSDNEEIVTVDAQGNLQGVAVGSTTVEVTVGSTVKTVNVEVVNSYDSYDIDSSAMSTYCQTPADDASIKFNTLLGNNDLSALKEVSFMIRFTGDVSNMGFEARGLYDVANEEYLVNRFTNRDDDGCADKFPHKDSYSFATYTPANDRYVYYYLNTSGKLNYIDNHPTNMKLTVEGIAASSNEGKYIKKDTWYKVTYVVHDQLPQTNYNTLRLVFTDYVGGVDIAKVEGDYYETGVKYSIDTSVMSTYCQAPADDASNIKFNTLLGSDDISNLVSITFSIRFTGDVSNMGFEARGLYDAANNEYLVNRFTNKDDDGRADKFPAEDSYSGAPTQATNKRYMYYYFNAGGKLNYIDNYDNMKFTIAGIDTRNNEGRYVEKDTWYTVTYTVHNLLPAGNYNTLRLVFTDYVGDVEIANVTSTTK